MGRQNHVRTFVVETVSGPTELSGDLDDPQVRSAYMEGQCVALALELHKRTGYPLVAVLGEPLLPGMTSSQMADVIAGGLHHVLVQGPEGIVVDIRGPRALRQYLEEEDPGFAPDQYYGRDTDFLSEADFHEDTCLCTDQCYPNASFAVSEVSAADLEYVIALGELPRPSRRAAGHYAAQLVKRFDLPRKVSVSRPTQSRNGRARVQ